MLCAAVITQQNKSLLLRAVADVCVNVQHLYQRSVEEAVFVQDVPDHPQGTTAQIAHLHQVFLPTVGGKTVKIFRLKPPACPSTSRCKYLHCVGVVLIYHGSAANGLQVVLHLHTGHNQNRNPHHPPLLLHPQLQTLTTTTSHHASCAQTFQSV